MGETRVQREAIALMQAGYDVDIIALSYPYEPAQEVCEGAMVYRMPVARNKQIGAVGQLLEYLRFFVLAFIKLSQLHIKRRYDVVQVHNLPDFLVFCALIPKLTGAKIILDLHDLMPEFFRVRFDAAEDSFFLRVVYLQERLSCAFADKVFTVTEHWRQSLVKRGVPAHKTGVLMNLADPNIFTIPPNYQHQFADTSRFSIIYHGVLTQRYGLDLVLEAIAQLKDEIPGLHFTVIGTGKFLDDLIQMTADLQIENHVSFLHKRVVNELPPFILNSHIGIVAYRDQPFTSELLPTKLLEYAALGIPAIVSRTPAIQLYFDDSNVMFFEPGNVEQLVACIRRLNEDRNLLARYSQAIQKFNQRYNWPNHSRDYVQTVEKLAGAG
jgi:glycosyltransferase involved in cell wall biosynthesis